MPPAKASPQSYPLLQPLPSSAATNSRTPNFREPHRPLAALLILLCALLAPAIVTAQTVKVEAESYTAMSGVVIEAKGATSNSLGYIENGDWSQYLVNIPAAGDYRITFSAASNTAGGTINVVLGTTVLGTATITKTNGWTTWVDFSTDVTFASAGPQTLRLNYIGTGTSSLYNLDFFTLSVPTPVELTVGNTRKQMMRYGLDYERLWYWYGSTANKNKVAQWSMVDCDVDYIRVAMNCEYELTEGSYDITAYTDKIIPMMTAMKAAKPDIKFFASPRPLNEASGYSNARWQPYPYWITGDPGNGSSFSFDWQKCAEYLVRYVNLMKSYGFKIDFIDMTNEWNYITPTHIRDIRTYMESQLAAADMPKIVANSAWSYSQGSGWLSGVNTATRRAAIDIASCHNTDKTGTAQDFADKVETIWPGQGKEVWNSELHGWKGNSPTDEIPTTSFMFEAIRAGFTGINGWLAIGTTAQGHCYILNNGTTVTRNVKYYIFNKLSNTGNYGNALDINQPADFESTVALIRGNLMTVWVLNNSAAPVLTAINLTGRTLSDTAVRRTRWNDALGVEGVADSITATSGTRLRTTIAGNSLYCYEFLLTPETLPYARLQVESSTSKSTTITTETTTDANGGQNFGNITNNTWSRHDNLIPGTSSTIRFRIAAPAGRPSGVIEVRLDSLTGTLIGRTAVPVTGGWQNWETIETPLAAVTGTHSLYLKYVEAGSTEISGTSMFNLNWLELTTPQPPVTVTATPVSATQINLAWDALPGATSYNVKRSTIAGGSYTPLSTAQAATTFSNTGLTPGTRYYYVVSATFTGSTGPDSTEVSAVPFAVQSPSGLNAAADSLAQISLTWNAVPGAASYNVKRGTASGSYTSFFTGVSTTSHTSTGLTAGTRYYFVVTAQFGSTESSPAPETSAVAFAIQTPANLTAAPASASSIDLTWSAVPGATSYNVKRGTVSGSYTSFSTGLTATALTSTGLTSGTRYYFVATAQFGIQESAPTPEISAVPSAPLVPADAVIATVATSNISGSPSINLTITKSGLGQSYQIFAADNPAATLWQPVGPVLTGNGGPLPLAAPILPGSPRMFYKVRIWRE